jgi:hypothetical protein
VVVGLHVLVPVIHQQVGIAWLDGSSLLGTSHAGLLRAAGIEAAAGDCRLGWLLTEGDGPGGLLIEDLCALVAAANGGVKLLNALLLLGLVAVEAEAIGKPLGAHRGGHRL